MASDYSSDAEYAASVADETRELIHERYERIRGERRSMLQLLLGLSGAALVASLTLLQFGPNRPGLAILISAWCLLAASVAVCAVELSGMTARSVRHQEYLEELVTENFRRLIAGKPPQLPQGHSQGRLPRYSRAEIRAAILFVGGFVCLSVFAVSKIL